MIFLHAIISHEKRLHVEHSVDNRRLAQYPQRRQRIVVTVVDAALRTLALHPWQNFAHAVTVTDTISNHKL